MFLTLQLSASDMSLMDYTLIVHCCVYALAGLILLIVLLQLMYC